MTTPISQRPFAITITKDLTKAIGRLPIELQFMVMEYAIPQNLDYTTATPFVDEKEGDVTYRIFSYHESETSIVDQIVVELEDEQCQALYKDVPNHIWQQNGLVVESASVLGDEFLAFADVHYLHIHTATFRIDNTIGNCLKRGVDHIQWAGRLSQLVCLQTLVVEVIGRSGLQLVVQAIVVLMRDLVSLSAIELTVYDSAVQHKYGSSYWRNNRRVCLMFGELCQDEWDFRRVGSSAVGGTKRK